MAREPPPNSPFTSYFAPFLIISCLLVFLCDWCQHLSRIPNRARITPAAATETCAGVCLCTFRFWECMVIRLNRSSFLRRLNLKGQVICDRCSNGREIEFVIAKALNLPGDIGRKCRQFINGWDTAFLGERI